MIRSRNASPIEMNNIMIFSSSIPDIGYISRTETKGKESDMVNQYLDYLTVKYSKMKKKKAAVFIEPLVDTGYPDIVIVEYNSTPNCNLGITRDLLNITDIKILFYVQMKKHTTVSEMNEMLGFPIDIIKKSLDRLTECKMVYYNTKNETVKNVQIDTFARIRKIISIEAKIDKWHEAIRQANNNTWFSTESYILLNKKACSSEIIETCQANGLGIILVNGTINIVLRSAERSFPVSYASLQFNEWVVRWLRRKEKII